MVLVLVLAPVLPKVLLPPPPPEAAAAAVILLIHTLVLEQDLSQG